MSCKVLDFGNFTPEENSSCKEGFPGLYNRFRMSKEEVEELIESGNFEMEVNSKGKVFFVRKEKKRKNKKIR